MIRIRVHIKLDLNLDPLIIYADPQHCKTFEKYHKNAATRTRPLLVPPGKKIWQILAQVQAPALTIKKFHICVVDPKCFHSDPDPALHLDSDPDIRSLDPSDTNSLTNKKNSRVLTLFLFLRSWMLH